MSTVQVALVRVRGVSAQGTSLPVAASEHVITPDAPLTSSGSASAASTLASASQYTGDEPKNYVWRVAVAGMESIHIQFAAAPVATSTNGFLCPAGGVYEFSCTAFGHKFSVINA